LRVLPYYTYAAPLFSSFYFTVVLLVAFQNAIASANEKISQHYIASHSIALTLHISGADDIASLLAESHRSFFQAPIMGCVSTLNIIDPEASSKCGIEPQ